MAGAGGYPGCLDTSSEVTSSQAAQPRSPPPRCCRCCRRRDGLVRGAVLMMARGTVLLILIGAARVVEATVRNSGVRVEAGVSCRAQQWRARMVTLCRLFPPPRRPLRPRLLLLCPDRPQRSSPASRLERKQDDSYRTDSKWRAPDGAPRAVRQNWTCPGAVAAHPLGLCREQHILAFGCQKL